jgi:hypothetical protein
VHLHEHTRNFKESLLEKSKLAQHACKVGHRVIWDEARILETESNSRYRKYKEYVLEQHFGKQAKACLNHSFKTITQQQQQH